MKKNDGKRSPPKEIRGEASFTVHQKGPVLQMLIHGKPIAEAQLVTGDEYDALFDHVKATVKALARSAGTTGATSHNGAGPSTRNLAALPEPARLRELMRALAVLDMILIEEWESRGYSFDPAWGSAQMGSWRDGSGDWFFVWFPGPDSAVIKGFGHESEMTPFKRPNEEPWPGLFDGLPEELSHARDMQEYPPEEVTYCIWHPAGGEWTIGPIQFPELEEDPDASALHLPLLDDNPGSYVRWVEKEWDPDARVTSPAVSAVYRGEPLTREIVAGIDPKADLARVVKEAKEMGYPVAKELEEQTTKPPNAVKRKAKPAPKSPPGTTKGVKGGKGKRR